MGPFKKFLTCIMAFFILITYLTLCQFYSFPSPVVFTKSSKFWNQRKEYFLYMAASVYHVISKEVENEKFIQNRIFKHTCLYKQLMLTKKWNYNIFVQILHSSITYTDLGCVFLVARFNIIRASQEIKKERSSCTKCI